MPSCPKTGCYKRVEVSIAIFRLNFILKQVKRLFNMFSFYQIFLFSLERWVHFGKDLELLDSPGIIPMRISDQSAAIKLAICDDIGERSYDVADVAAILVQVLKKIPAVGLFLLPLQLIMMALQSFFCTFIHRSSFVHIVFRSFPK